MTHIEDLGKDFTKNAGQFAMEAQEWRKKYDEQFKKNLDLSHVLLNMFVCFHCLTIEGGWDTMDDEMKKNMIECRDEARKVLVRDGSPKFKVEI